MHVLDSASRSFLEKHNKTGSANTLKQKPTCCIKEVFKKIYFGTPAFKKRVQEIFISPNPVTNSSQNFQPHKVIKFPGNEFWYLKEISNNVIFYTRQLDVF